MEELRWAFLVLGGCAIVAILAHGLWSVRKNAQKDKQEYQPRALDDLQEDDEQVTFDSDIHIDDTDPLLSNSDLDDRTSAAYDALGIGQVRVVSQTSVDPSEQQEEQESVDLAQGENFEAPSDLSADGPAPEALDDQEDSHLKAVPTPAEKPKMYASVVTQPKPEYVAEQQAREERQRNWSAPSEVPEPPASLLKSEELEAKPKEAEPTKSEKQEPSFDLTQTPISASKEDRGASPAEKISLAEQARNLVKGKKDGTKRKKKAIDEDQMRIDFDEPDAAAKGEAVEQEVLILNVKAAPDKAIPGSALLPMLLTLGFKFGDQNIFHRHVNSNGKGPVLFSLANMFKPGDFDIDNLENFTTQGISLFMILPIEGDPHQVFNMMHNAARKIADEFSAQVLDGRRSALTKQSLQQYVEKIREFERKRRISR